MAINSGKPPVPGGRRNPVPQNVQNGGGGRGGGGGNGNGGGGGGNGGGGRRNGGAKARGALYQRALRDVHTSYLPMLNAISQAGLQAKQQYGTDSQRVGDIYSALTNQLQPMTGQYTQNISGISGDLQNQLQSLTGMIGSNVQGVPQSEIGAGAGMLGSLGAGALEQIANDRTRNAAYNTSAERQGGIEGMTAQRNYLQDYQNLQDQFNQQRLQIQNQMPQQIRTEMGTLRDQQWQQHMDQLKYQLSAAQIAASNRGDKATAAYLRSLIGNITPPGGNHKPRRHPSTSGGGTHNPPSNHPLP